MSKRNFILLIIVLIILLIGVFGFLYFNQPKSGTTGSSTPGTNFFSQFGLGSGKTNTPPVVTPPTNVSGYQPPAPVVAPKLIKVSSMPIAGFTFFMKERLKAVPVVAATAPSTTPTTDNSTTQSATSSSPTTSVITNTPSTTPQTTTKSGKKVKAVKPTPPPTELVPALRYVAKSNGNIYETFADNIAEGQFSTTVIPQVYDAYFGNSGNSVAMRYLADEKTIATFLGTLPKEVLGADTIANNSVKGSLLPNDIESIGVSGDASSMFYLFDSGDNMIGTTLNLATNKKVQAFNSPFTEWLAQWPNSKIITLTTKAASGIPGYMYTMDSSGKNFNQVLGNINGLTTLTSPSGKLVLYGDDGLNLSVYNTDTNTSTLLGVKTLPEKCTWNSGSVTVYCAVPRSIDGGQYPDTWYQGEVSFSDQIWSVDMKSGNTTLLVDPTTVSGGEDIDGIKLALDPSESYLSFVNKKDSFLWELNLK
jgi:hypothetical protein